MESMNRFAGGVALGLALGASALAEPAWAQGAAHTEATVEVPLGFVDGRPTVPVMGADGAELRFAVSTGNGTTVLTESLAARGATVAALTLGGVTVPLEGRATVPDAGLKGATAQLDGIIGANMLRDYDVLLDAPRGRLVLRPVGRSVSWPDVALSEPVPLRIFHGLVISLDVTVDGSDYPATLDTGTPVLLANPAAGERLALGKTGRVTVSFDGASIPDVPVRVEDHPVLQRWAPDGSAFLLLGGAIAADCAVSISWVHREMRVCAR